MKFKEVIVESDKSRLTILGKADIGSGTWIGYAYAILDEMGESKLAEEIVAKIGITQDEFVQEYRNVDKKLVGRYVHGTADDKEKREFVSYLLRNSDKISSKKAAELPITRGK
jgi:hypothetical protein